MKLHMAHILFVAAILCLLAAFTTGAIPVSAAVSDNTNTVYLQNWGHSGGQSYSSSWGNSVWVPLKTS